MPSTPQEGDLRVWNIVNVPNFAIYVPVSTPEDAIRIINYMAEDQLKEERITSNVFGLEVFEDGEWTDWYNELGEDIDECAQALEDDDA